MMLIIMIILCLVCLLLSSYNAYYAYSDFRKPASMAVTPRGCAPRLLTDLSGDPQADAPANRKTCTSRPARREAK